MEPIAPIRNGQKQRILGHRLESAGDALLAAGDGIAAQVGGEYGRDIGLGGEQGGSQEAGGQALASACSAGLGNAPREQLRKSARPTCFAWMKSCGTWSRSAPANWPL